MTKIYVAGPMTGYPEWNFPAFFEAEKQLIKLGYEVLNPAHSDGTTLELALESAGIPERPNHTWAWYMRRDLPHVLDCDALCVLPGWQESKGASLEVHVANAIGIPIYILKDGNLIPRVKVLGISGWARAGKDTAADWLVEHRGFTKRSFAAPIKSALKKLSPSIDVEGMHVPLETAVRLLGWEALKSVSNEVRPLLQRFGTEVGREMFGENFWVEFAINSIPDGSKVVFADVRYPNEADAIKELGGEVWRINREGFGAANDHESEHALNGYDFDAVINNSDTIETLYKEVEQLL